MSNGFVTLHTAGLVVIKGGKLLLAFSGNKNAWYREINILMDRIVLFMI